MALQDRPCVLCGEDFVNAQVDEGDVDECGMKRTGLAGLKGV